jgi:hypothetical protein
MKFFIITFHIRLCDNFALPQIGFVFSNRPAGETPDLLSFLLLPFPEIGFVFSLTAESAKIAEK